MSLLSASVAFLLATTPPPPSTSTAPGLKLHEKVPAGFKADGKLEEWKVPASLSLGAAHQVQGTLKVSSPQDLSAQVWLALGPEGLAVAGEVRDDRVNLASRPEQLHHDHVQVWLSLPQPAMPPIAFVNQAGEHPLPTAEACENNKALSAGTSEGCRKWWKAQVEHREKLVRSFTSQYALMTGGVVRVGQKGMVGSVRYVPMTGGYRFEALIPPGAFPRSAEAPLRNLKVLVDLVDSDEGKGKPETVVSSTPGRRSAEPETFQAVVLGTPLRFGAWPDLFERALKANERAVYQPAADVRAFEVWLNKAVGDQQAPSAPSPEVVKVDMSRMEEQATLGSVELMTVPAKVEPHGAIGFWMVSRRSKNLLDTQYSGTRVLLHTEREPDLHILQVTENTQSPLGTGPCGKCPQLAFQWVKMDAQGRFSAPEPLEGARTQGEPLGWEATPDLSRIEVFTQKKETEPRQLILRHTWEPKTGRYTLERASPQARD
jgi:hypothetical protein